MKPGRTFPLVLAIAIVASVVGLFAGPLRAPDEIREAEIAREMAISGDYVLPRLCGDPFLEHPPLQYALMALSFKVFGVGDIAARVPSAIFGFLLILVIHALGRRAGGDRAGLLGALAWLSTRAYHQYGTRGMVDVPLTLFVALGYFSFVLALTRIRETPEGEHPRGVFPAVLLIYAAAAMAQLTKGPVGLILIAGPVVAGLVLTRSFVLLRTSAHLLGIVVLFVPLAVWVLLLRSHGGPEAFETFFYQNFLYRIFPVAEYVGGHQHGPLYYFAGLPGMALPWLLTLPAVLVCFVFRRRPADAAGTIPFFLALVFPMGVLLLSVPGTKRPLYLLPLVPPLCAATGVWLALRAKTPGFSRLERVTWGVLGVPFALGNGLLTLLASVLLAPALLLFPRALTVAAGSRAILKRGVLATRNLVGARAARRGPAIAWTLAIVTLVAMIVMPRLGSRTFDLTPLAREIRTAGVLGPDLVTYNFGERDRAALSFRTRAIFPNLVYPGDLIDFLDVRESGYLAARRGDGALDLGRHEHRFERMKDWTIGDRVYDLYRFTK